MESGWNSNGFQRKPFREAPGFRPFRQIPADSVGMSMELETGMAEAPAN
jgi:hypothetical protein